LEIDSSKFEPELTEEQIKEILKERYKLLEHWTDKILDCIWNEEAIKKMPKEVRLLATFIAETSEEKKLNTPLILTGYILLRYINPGKKKLLIIFLFLKKNIF
jgi:hypothetical protein